MKSEVPTWSFLGILCFSSLLETLQGSPASSSYYIGAVVEYHPIREGENAEAVAIANAGNHVIILKKAKEMNSNLDIVVFPETGITTSGDGDDLLSEKTRKHVAPAASYIPSPSEKVTPCGNESTNVKKTLKIISCAAKKYQTYVVVNHLEREDCSKCASDNMNLYNTNIVFDRSGTIIARYRKYNLFGEQGTNVTSKPELSTFDTDFGVKFGQFICFDILFRSPALDLLKQFNVTDIVYSTHWFSMLPFFDELGIQAAWSYANDVNFLASGFNNPSSGSTGSGIYAGKYETLGTFRSETEKNSVLIARVPKVMNGERSDSQNETVLHEFSIEEVSTTIDKSSEGNIFATEELTDYTTKLIGPDVEQNFVLTNDHYSCYFTYKANYDETVLNSKGNYFRYRFGVFSGMKSNGAVGVGGELKICGLIACKNDSLSSCGQRFNKDETLKTWVSFEQLEITAMMPRNYNVSKMNLPVSLQTNFIPLNPSDFVFESQASETSEYDSIALHLKNPRANLMSFGILSREFTPDGYT